MFKVTLVEEKLKVYIFSSFKSFLIRFPLSGRLVSRARPVVEEKAAISQFPARKMNTTNTNLEFAHWTWTLCKWTQMPWKISAMMIYHSIISERFRHYQILQFLESKNQTCRTSARMKWSEEYLIWYEHLTFGTKRKKKIQTLKVSKHGWNVAFTIYRKTVEWRSTLISQDPNSHTDPQY